MSRLMQQMVDAAIAERDEQIASLLADYKHAVATGVKLAAENKRLREKLENVTGTANGGDYKTGPGDIAAEQEGKR